VAADLVDIAAGRRAPPFGVPTCQLRSATVASMDDHCGAFYIRLMLRDHPGVFAEIAAALRDESVSMEAILQRGRAPGETVPVVMTVHDTQDSAMSRAIRRIAAIDAVVEPPRLIRIEEF
jgi:homoserine dehydrogenase